VVWFGYIAYLPQIRGGGICSLPMVTTTCRPGCECGVRRRQQSLHIKSKVLEDVHLLLMLLLVEMITYVGVLRGDVINFALVSAKSEGDLCCKINYR
jgi:hypothetical protein